VVRNLPKDLAAICTKGLQARNGRRYATAAAFAADLRHWLCDEPTVARPARAPRRLWLWSRRNKGWAAASAPSCWRSWGSRLGPWGTPKPAERATAAARHEAAASEEATKAAKREAEAAKREAEVAGRQV